MKNFISKNIKRVLIAGFLLLSSMFISGCESTGAYWCETVPASFTPGVSATTVERTYDKNGNPVEKEIQNEPALR